MSRLDSNAQPSCSFRAELALARRRALLSTALHSASAQLTHLDPQSGLVHIPPSLSYIEAATLPIAAVTSWHSLFAHPGAVLIPGQTVLILGTGGVSIFAAQLAIAGGCNVIATSSSNEKLERAKELGVMGGVNYRENKEWHEEVIKINGGKGVDHVIEGALLVPPHLRCSAIADPLAHALPY